MQWHRLKFRLAALGMGFAIWLPGWAGEPKVQFSRDIRPILSENCFKCHGPEEKSRRAKLRLDQKQGAFADLNGHFALVAGRPEESVLLQRIMAADDAGRMPPPKAAKRLSEEQAGKIKTWIEQGAVWQDHWAFAAISRPQIPAVKNKDWARNAIDHFILARLEAEGLQPSPEANREALVRRVSLDLTGLPPTPGEVEAFLEDRAPDAYERLVDRLLRSPRYAEQMARYWLDGARYGDTHGLHLDNERAIWPYRDWVIKAFASNKPFDQFTIEQLAGDLLPEPARDQWVATGFIRCNVSTSEGGAIPEEFAARYAVDRVETMSTVWMGLTTGCAACHDHKFDPITQKEFYQLFAFYNNLDEDPMDGNALLHPPYLRLATVDQEKQMASLDRALETVKRFIKAGLASVEYQDSLTTGDINTLTARDYIWIDDDLPGGAQASKDDAAWKFVDAEPGPVLSGRKSHTQTAEKTAQHFFSDARVRLRVGKGDKLFTYVYLDAKNPPKAIMLQFNTDGWDHRAFWGEDLIDFGQKDTPGRKRVGDLPEPGKWVRLEVDPGQVGLSPGASLHGWAFAQHGGTVFWDQSGIVSKWPQGDEGFDSLLLWDTVQQEIDQPNLPEGVRKAVKTERAKRTPEQQTQIRDYFLENVFAGTRAIFDPLHEEMSRASKAREALDGAIPKTLITRELKSPRPTHILKRGEYDKKGDQVFADVPAFLPRLPQNAPTNRLGLAQWLVDPSHPLTARVMVNRFWQYHFGVGLVKTSENFGSQGDSPSHPELLDWLATEFTGSGWDIRLIHRLMVCSAAYRQASRVRPELQEKDPDNRLLARGPRFRLDAESIRDSVLAVSGLLVEKVGGRGVNPYQPEGIWEAVAYPTSTTAKFKQDPGEALYRRSLYTFWKRTAPPPSMTTFDAPARESCRVRRERTNTPLQSLALLNDVQYVEAARYLAGRILKEGGKTLDQRIGFAFRLATARQPDTREFEMLRELYQTQFAEYERQPEEAKKLIHVGESKAEDQCPAAELAAWTILANTILNLSEFIAIN